jgi:predicted Zn finger-like uncharacterized protein
MARLIKCPRCQAQIDVTSVSGGAAVRCPDCGQMVRVPTGQTGQYPKVAAQVPQPAAAARSETRVRTGGRSTDLFRKMAGARAPGASGRPPSRASVDAEMRGSRRGGSGAGLAIGAAIGAVVLIGLLILMVTSQRSKEAEARAEKERRKAEVARKNEETRRKNAEEDAAYEAALAKQNAEAAKNKPKAALQKEGGKYVAPPSFEAGALKWVKGDMPELGIDSSVNGEFEKLAAAGNVAELVQNDHKWLPYIINGFLSENEAVARGAFQAMAAVCDKHKISTESGKNPVNLELFNSAQWRGGEFMHWSDWWPRNKGELTARGGKGADVVRVVGEDPARAKWDEIMQALRPGGGYDDIKRPEGFAFQKVKNMGPGAYPYIVKYIDHEDIALARAAVAVLNELTNQKRPLPNEQNKAALKAEWESYIKR